jgi:hypothetical protein
MTERGQGHVLQRRVVGTDGRIRTDTGGGLSAVPLPVLGYVSVVDRAGVEPATFSVQGSCASCCASGPWWRVRGSNPPGEGYGPSLISRSPAVGGVTGRTRTGFLRGHDPACRPLQLRPQSTRRESNPRRPPCEGGGLPLTYSSLVGRASWSRTTSCRGISAVPSPSGSRPWFADVDAGGLESPAACVSCRCATVCATRRLVVPGVLEPPPAGFRPAAPPSELQDRACLARGPADRRFCPCGHHWKGEVPPGLRIGRGLGRRRGSNPLLLGYGPSVLAFRTSPARTRRWSTAPAGGVGGGVRTLAFGVGGRRAVR